MIRHLSGVLSICLMIALAGCSSETPVDPTGAARQPSAEGAQYLLTEAPGDAQDVIPMRGAIENDQEVVVVGRIGGSQDPWVEGMAAFSLVDRSLAACTDIPGDQCPTPWDYCCVTDKLPDATTLVKVVDEQGEIVPTGAQQLLGVSELQTVVIKGKARKDDAGNVTVLTSAIYVDPANPGQVKRGDAPDHEHDHDHPHDDHHDHDPEGEGTTSEKPKPAENERENDS